MTVRGLTAARELKADYVDVAFLHLPTIKPFARETVLRETAKGRLVVTLENHGVVGGLAESVASCLAFARQTARIVPIGLPDEFLAAGALPTLHDPYGLSVAAIKDRFHSEL